MEGRDTGGHNYQHSTSATREPTLAQCELHNTCNVVPVLKATQRSVTPSTTESSDLLHETRTILFGLNILVSPCRVRAIFRSEVDAFVHTRPEYQFKKSWSTHEAETGVASPLDHQACPRKGEEARHGEARADRMVGTVPRQGSPIRTPTRSTQSGGRWTASTREVGGVSARLYFRLCAGCNFVAVRYLAGGGTLKDWYRV